MAKALRLTKNFVKDEVSLLNAIKGLGAEFSKSVEQVDSIYFIDPVVNGNKMGRVKVRYEKGFGHKLYLYNRETDEIDANFTYFKLPNQDGSPLPLGDVPDVIVEKQRTVWLLGEYIFHMDKIKGVGEIFEIEHEGINFDVNSYVELMGKFSPFLGDKITGSNEDLINDQNYKKESV